MPCVLRPAAMSADCLAMPHLVHAVVSMTSGVIFFVVAILLVRRARRLGSKQEHCWQQQPHRGAAPALATEAVSSRSASHSRSTLCRCWVITSWSP